MMRDLHWAIRELNRVADAITEADFMDEAAGLDQVREVLEAILSEDSIALRYADTGRIEKIKDLIDPPLDDVPLSRPELNAHELHISVGPRRAKRWCFELFDKDDRFPHRAFVPLWTVWDTDIRSAIDAIG